MSHESDPSARPSARRDERSRRRAARSRRRAATAAALVGLAVAPYLGALRGGFVYDDRGLVEHHPAVQAPFDLGAILGARYWGERRDTRLWRPVATLSFALDDAIADDDPHWMHAANVAAHALATILAWLLARALLGARTAAARTAEHAGAADPDGRRRERAEAAAFATAALFAVHPAHSEAVAWIAGRAEVLAAIGVFAALRASLAPGVGPALACGAATAFAVGAKESAAFVAPLLVALLALRSRAARPTAAAVGASVAALAAMLAARAFVLGGLAPPVVGVDENPMVGAGFVERLPTVLDAFGRHLALLAWPRVLAIDYGPPTLGLLPSMSARAWLGAAAACALAVLALRRRAGPASALALFVGASYAVASNAFVVIGTNFAERLFYAPSFGVLGLVAWAASRALPRATPARKRALAAALAVALAALAARTALRTRDYRDDLALADATLAVHPASPKMLYNRARELERRGRHVEAVDAAQRAVAADGDPTWAPVVLANALVGAGRADEAEGALRTALARDARNDPARRRLIELLEARGDLDGADALADEAARDAAAGADWLARSALGAQRRGALARAAERWEAALAAATEPRPSWHRWLGLARLGLGDAARARAALEDALALAPDDAPALNALAWLATTSDDAALRARAVALARRAVALAPTPDHRDTLARALEAAGDCRAALAEAALAATSGEREQSAPRCDRGALWKARTEPGRPPSVRGGEQRRARTRAQGRHHHLGRHAPRADGPRHGGARVAAVVADDAQRRREHVGRAPEAVELVHDRAVLGRVGLVRAIDRRVLAGIGMEVGDDVLREHERELVGVLLARGDERVVREAARDGADHAAAREAGVLAAALDPVGVRQTVDGGGLDGREHGARAAGLIEGVGVRGGRAGERREEADEEQGSHGGLRSGRATIRWRPSRA
ncbi:MAG: hypothetical protein R3E88_18495 [Myxococcota bacterium]